MAKQKYYRTTKIKKCDADYNIIYGERSNGKSYAVIEDVLRTFENTGRRFMLLRRYEEDFKRGWLEDYFKDKPISAIFGENYNGATMHTGKIFINDVSDENKPKRGKHVGYCRALTRTTATKSANFDDVDDVIFEEFITNDGYLANEVEKLMQMISTIARRRKIRVWLIGNTISRMCPYFTTWGLNKIPRQKQGTIDIYNFETGDFDEDNNKLYVKIAVEYAENSGRNSKMFFGKIGESISGGAWESKNFKRLPKNIREYNKLYPFVVEWESFKFLCHLMCDAWGYYFIYVEPKTSAIRENERVISNTLYLTMMYTNNFTVLNDADKISFNLINTGHIFYSDNLTGTEFNACLKHYL